MDAGGLEAAWYGFPHLQSVALKAGPTYRAVDLGTGAVFPDMQGRPEVVVRARAAVDAARKLLLPPPHVPVHQPYHSRTPESPFLIHESPTGRIWVKLTDRPLWLCPTSDGRPRFRTFPPVAQWAGNTLALLASQPQTWSLHNLDNDGATLAEYPTSKFGTAKLSPDGLRFVRQTQSGVLRVTEPAGGRTILVTERGRCHSNLEVRLGSRCLGMSVGGRGCFLDWTGTVLRVTHGPTAADDFGGRAKNPLRAGSVHWLDWMSGRFVGWQESEAGRFVGDTRYPFWVMGVDCFGQIAFARNGRVACMFIFRRGKLAAWAPGGVRYGPSELTGGPETPAALERLGEALRHMTG
jgi:hypothetical protein